MRFFWNRFSLNEKTVILDVGGTESSWLLLKKLPTVILLNIRAPAKKDERFAYVVADGCHLPFRKGTVDLVYSNSVIEHVNTLQKQVMFSSECIRVGRRYYVQTPNKRFFVEPHFITPFLHWFPLYIQVKFLRNFTAWGLITRPSLQQCHTILNEVRLLDEKELKELFPDAEIWHERFLGMTKSLIAAKVH
jgi:hypothetical protein